MRNRDHRSHIVYNIQSNSYAIIYCGKLRWVRSEVVNNFTNTDRYYIPTLDFVNEECLRVWLHPENHMIIEILLDNGGIQVLHQNARPWSDYNEFSI